MAKTKAKTKRKASEEFRILDKEMEHIVRLAETDPILAKLLRLYMDYLEDPSSTWRSMVVHATRKLNTELKNGTLDIVDDGLHRSMWEMLKGGNSVSKTIKTSIEDGDDSVAEDGLPGIEEAHTVPIINAETAGMG